MDDETISMFTSLTGATSDQAQQYMQLAEGNLEQAAQLWFETGGSLATTTTTAAPTSQPQGHTSQNPINLDSDDEDMDLGGGDLTRPQPNIEDDEAMARRLQEEMYGSGAGRGQDDVRAPIGRTTETLVGPGSMGYGGGMGYGGDDDDVEAQIAAQIAARQARRAQGRPGIFNQLDTQSSIWAGEDPTSVDALSHSTGGASSQSARAHSLAEMFRPPFELITRLPWDQARDQGREDHKWLLVNVQDPAIFDCQVLNRDLWKDERVSAVIKESFIFLQYSRSDLRSEGYIQYYFGQQVDNPDAYPHIAIVDPRTGEQMKIWSGRPVPKVDEFVEALYNFLDRYSLDVAKKNPVAKRKAAEAPKTFDTMTEEEQLELAMQQSLANGGGTAAGGSSLNVPRAEDPDDLTKSVDFGQVKAQAGDNDEELVGTQETNGESMEAAAFKAIPSDRPHEEPPADPKTTTRIQFRHPGGRVVRRFSLEDPVRRIYEWLKAAPPDPEHAGKTFDLMFMGKNLIESLDATIEQAGLKNASLNIEWTED